MVGTVDLVDGQKEPVATSGGSGNPLGTIIAVYSNLCPIGYLPCNGVAFDINQFPALYTLLGDNHTPDLRECALVGIGESGRASSELATHDVYTLGQFKDDQVQDHTHASTGANGNFPQVGSIVGQGAYSSVTNSNFTTGSITYGRVGTTTHGKQIGVNYCIKALTGLDETQQDYMFEVICRAGSYSTDEINTGKKWIDGKPIYRKTVNFGTLPNSTTKVVAHNISNIDTMIDYYGTADDGTYFIPIPRPGTSATDRVDIFCTRTDIHITTTGDSTAYVKNYVTLEYTKTTPST